MKKDCWPDLKNILQDIYRRKNVFNSFVDDEKYLEGAFRFTESFWRNQFESFERICFVLLGEAPLFGEQKSYFYNEDSKLTAFFRHKIRPNVVSFSSTQNKSDLFKHLRELGFIILDLFPYALNEKTAINYKNHIRGSSYIDLLEKTYNAYLEPKLRLLKMKPTKGIRFCLRYKKHKIIADLISRKLNSLELLDSGGTVNCVGSSNMHLDKEKLGNEYKKACNTL